MRAFLLFSFFLLCSFYARSQSKYTNLFQFNYIASSGGGDGSIAGLKYAGTFSAGNHITAGGGVGYDVWFDNVAQTFHFSSVLADLRYYFRGSESGPDFFFTPGYAVKIFDNSATGFNLNSGLGSKIPLNDKQQVIVGLGFAFQNVRNQQYRRDFRGVSFNVGIAL